MTFTQKHSLHTLAVLLISACSPTPDNPFADEQTLLELHEQSREAHFKKNPGLLVGQFSGDMISVNRGKVSLASREKATERFQQYFDAVEFKKWDDVKPPVVRFSKDRSIGYVIVDKMVVLETTDSLGKRIEESTHFAWVSIFRKDADGNYQLECIASTNEPEQVTSLE